MLDLQNTSIGQDQQKKRAVAKKKKGESKHQYLPSSTSSTFVSFSIRFWNFNEALASQNQWRKVEAMHTIINFILLVWLAVVQLKNCLYPPVMALGMRAVKSFYFRCFLKNQFKFYNSEQNCWKYRVIRMVLWKFAIRTNIPYGKAVSPWLVILSL